MREKDISVITDLVWREFRESRGLLGWLFCIFGHCILIGSLGQGRCS